MKMNKSTTYQPESSTTQAISATPADITPPDDIYVMRCVADTNVLMTWPNAGTVKLVSGIPEYFQCHPGDAISVVRDTADGELQVAWMTN